MSGKPDGLPSCRNSPSSAADDTQSTRTLVQSIISCGGAFSPPDFMGRLGALGKYGGILGMGGTTKSSLERYLAGVPWREACTGLVRPSNGSAMRTGPIGLLHWREEDAELCARDARLQSQVTHKDLLAQTGAVAMSRERPLRACALLVMPLTVCEMLARSGRRPRLPHSRIRR